jgi:NDP-sugar pyrophosphorylase family protein
MNPYHPQEFFDLSNSPAAFELFKDITYVWEGVAALPTFIERILEPKILGEVEEGAWVEPGKVQMEPGSRVERGAVVRGPTIIGRNTVVRSKAYIRGHVMLGENCTIGHGVEIRQILVLNNSQIAHTNIVTTSLIGNRVQVAYLAGCLNCRLDGKPIRVKIDRGEEKQEFPTELFHLGACVGDDSKMGAMAILQPGTVVGQRCVIYPQCSVGGYVPNDSIVKLTSQPVEVIPRNQSQK